MLVCQQNLRKLIQVSEQYKRLEIPVQMVKDILSTTTQDVADDIIAQIPGELTFLWVSSIHPSIDRLRQLLPK